MLCIFLMYFYDFHIIGININFVYVKQISENIF